MKVAFFNTKPYDRQSFTTANEKHNHEIVFFQCHLSHEHAVANITEFANK